MIIITSMTGVAQQGPRQISRIEVEGLRRLSRDDVISVIGLKPGDTFSVTAVDGAGQKLIDTGLFAKVGYRTRTKGNQITIVFQVEELQGHQSPVTFDNFVWFTNEELTIAIRRELPTFIGKAQDEGNVIEKIKLVLQNLLNEKQIKGTVVHEAWLTSSKSGQEHLFSVSGVRIPICTLHFQGARNVSEETLVKTSRELLDADYSYKSALAFGNLVLSSLYKEVGNWRAKFGDPIPKYSNSETCNSGVDLTIPVDEGPIYLWNKAEWVGNQVLSPAELDEALGMKSGEVVKASKLDKGLLAVNQAYGRIGRLDVSTKAKPEFDDKGSRVTFKVEVKEGPRYTMGSLFIKGVSEADTRALEEAWKLRRSEVFNSSYLDQFFRIDGANVVRRIIVTRLEMGKSQPRIETDIKRNALSLTADVVLEFND